MENYKHQAQSLASVPGVLASFMPLPHSLCTSFNTHNSIIIATVVALMVITSPVPGAYSALSQVHSRHPYLILTTTLLSSTVLSALFESLKKKKTDVQSSHEELRLPLWSADSTVPISATRVHCLQTRLASKTCPLPLHSHALVLIRPEPPCN